MTGHGQITGRHVLLAFLGFFGVIIAVNGVFVYFATSSWTGLETDNAYIRGLAYNRVIEAAEAQRALGWDVSVDVTATEPFAARIAMTFAGPGGRPLDDLTVSAAFRRPATESHDHEVALDPVGAGQYGVALDLPLAGNWDVRMAAWRDGAEVYVVEQRVWIK